MSAPGPMGKVLIVDDEPSMCALLVDGLEQHGIAAVAKTSAADALDALAADDFAVVLTDLHMKGMSGLELCERVALNRPDVPVVVLTAFGSLETAIAAIRAGAYDFVTKPVEIPVVALTLERALRHRALREEVKRLRRVVSEPTGFEEILGTSATMRRLYDLLDRVASSDATVLVTGESGTGKELVARALHRRGPRRAGPFVALNCAAVPESLLESELFGHVKGAFTDARASRPGLLAQADGGTLFLDEIADIPLALQPKLLRALQERAFRPVGGDHEVRIDVRLISATNRDLEAAVEEGRFREDLYYRVHVIHVEIPPLRARGGDILLLAQHFLGRIAARMARPVAGITGAAAEKLMAYSWMGNVRELENCMERAVALASHEQVTVDDLPEKIRNYTPAHLLVAGTDPSELVPMEEIERRYILRVLESAGGNRTLAARILGLDRKTLYRKLARYDDARAGG